MTAVHNLYHTPLPLENGEMFSPLFESGTVKIEAIRSWLKEPGELYDQDQDEWVLLLSGEAHLEIEGKGFFLKGGDYCLLPRHTSHRVLSTSKNALWLTVFSS